MRCGVSGAGRGESKWRLARGTTRVEHFRSLLTTPHPRRVGITRKTEVIRQGLEKKLVGARDVAAALKGGET